MSLTPITEAALWDELNCSWERMNWPQRRLWEVIRISPEKWKQHPHANRGGGFWVVGILGNWVIWYNDIEEGFNLSKYTTFGVIDEYFSNSDNLEWTIEVLLDWIANGNRRT
jgi:hypothetical protein